MVFPVHHQDDHTHTHTYTLSSAYCVPARVLRLGFCDNRSHPLKVCEKQPKHPIYMHSSPWLICRPLILYVCPGNRGAMRTNIYCCSQSPNESRLAGALSEMGLSCCSFLSQIPSFTFSSRHIKGRFRGFRLRGCLSMHLRKFRSSRHPELFSACVEQWRRPPSPNLTEPRRTESRPCSYE